MRAAGLDMGERVVWAGIAAILLAACWIETTSAFNHDLAFTLVGAERLLDGGRFGVDLVDPNPPLSWWIAVIPIALARYLPLSPELAAILFTFALVIASLALAAPALRCVRRGNMLLLITSAILVLTPGYDFGQREHWMAILGLPWVIAAAVDQRGYRRVAIGLLAGVAFCLKPYFLLVPLAVECWSFYRYRSVTRLFRLENLVFAGFAIAYFVAIVATSPSYLADVVPAAMAVYWAFDGTVGEIAFDCARLVLLFGVPIVLLRRHGGGLPPIVQALLAAALGALACAVVQHKGWDYHWLPARMFASVAGFALLLQVVPRPGVLPIRLLALWLLLLGAFGDTLAGFRERQATERLVERISAAIVREGGKGATIFGFVTTPRHVFPAVLQANARWVSTACCVQWLPAVTRAGEQPPTDAERTRQVAATRFAALLTELERQKPKLLLIDNRRAKLGFVGGRFDYLPFLGRDRRFVALQAHYEQRPSAGPYLIFARRVAPR